MRRPPPNMASPVIPDPEIAAICHQFAVSRLDLFGSAVTVGFNSDRSDLDFLVALELLEPAAYADAYFGLRDALANLFECEVDLVTEASLANPYFRQNVESQRRTLFDLG